METILKIKKETKKQPTKNVVNKKKAIKTPSKNKNMPKKPIKEIQEPKQKQQTALKMGIKNGHTTLNVPDLV